MAIDVYLALPRESFSEIPDEIMTTVKKLLLEGQEIGLTTFEPGGSFANLLKSLDQNVGVIPSQNFITSLLAKLPENLADLDVTDDETLKEYAHGRRLLELIKECQCLPPNPDDDDDDDDAENSMPFEE